MNSLGTDTICPICGIKIYRKEGHLNSHKSNDGKVKKKYFSKILDTDPETSLRHTIILCDHHPKATAVIKKKSLQLPQDAVNCAFMGNVPIKE